MSKRLITSALIAIVVAVNSAEDGSSHLVISADGWVELPQVQIDEESDAVDEERDVTDEDSSSTSRGFRPEELVAPEESSDPTIEVELPGMPASYFVEGSIFPTFPVHVVVRSGASNTAVDRNSLKVTAHKGFLYKDITKAVEEYLSTNDCDEHLCNELSIYIDQFDLSQKGVGKYRFKIRVKNAQGNRAKSEIIVVISNPSKSG